MKNTMASVWNDCSEKAKKQIFHHHDVVPEMVYKNENVTEWESRLHKEISQSNPDNLSLVTICWIESAVPYGPLNHLDESWPTFDVM